MSFETGELFSLDAAWVAKALLLSDEAGWNQTAADWGVFIGHGTVLGVAADGQLVGSAAVLPYGPDFGWIAMVLVSRPWRGRGIATRLVAACTKRLRDAGRAAFLDATAADAAVYAGLGFVPVNTMQRFAGLGGGRGLESDTPADFSFDRAAFGADRKFLLEDFLQRPGSHAFACPSGFAILRGGGSAMQIGPMVAAPVDAPGLAAAAIDAASGPVIIDVLEDGRALIPLLGARGFVPQRPFTRMALGRADAPGATARLLAAAGPEFG